MFSIRSAIKQSHGCQPVHGIHPSKKAEENRQPPEIQDLLFSNTGRGKLFGTTPSFLLSGLIQIQNSKWRRLQLVVGVADQLWWLAFRSISSAEIPF